MTAHLGIDPGLGGALVALDTEGLVLAASVMPTLPAATGGRRVLDVAGVSRFVRELGPCRVVLEQPSVRQGEGARRSLSAGRNHGRIEGLLFGLGLSVELVHPRRRQVAPCPGTGDPKVRALAACGRLLPALDLTPGRRTKAHDGLADAGLLALYGVRQWGG